jgi:hypothetical protein
MRLIPLTQGFSVQVDDWNYDWLMQWRWKVLVDKNNYYAVRSTGPKKKRKMIMMHRVIMNTPPELVVDHRDHNGLNNLEENMRNCTRQQNNMNQRNYGKSRYHGVRYSRQNKFRSVISINGTSIHLGIFKTEEEAARAYDAKAKELFGEFANLNFKDKWL